MPRTIYLDEEIPTFTLKCDRPGLSKVFVELMNRSFDFNKPWYRVNSRQFYMQEREFIQEPISISISEKKIIKYQGEVLKGSLIPHGRGIQIIEKNDATLYYEGWFVCGKF